MPYYSLVSLYRHPFIHYFSPPPPFPNASPSFPLYRYIGSTSHSSVDFAASSSFIFHPAMCSRNSSTASAALSLKKSWSSDASCRSGFWMFLCCKPCSWHTLDQICLPLLWQMFRHPRHKTKPKNNNISAIVCCVRKKANTFQIRDRPFGVCSPFESLDMSYLELSYRRYLVCVVNLTPSQSVRFARAVCRLGSFKLLEPSSSFKP